MSVKPIDKSQPAVRPGEVLAPCGRWNEAALKRIHQHAGAELVWTEGTLGFSISVGGVLIGRLNRHRKGMPWTIRIEGYERWHEPTRLIKHWHYTPVWSAPTLVAAKQEVVKVRTSIPTVDA